MFIYIYIYSYIKNFLLGRRRSGEASGNDEATMG